MLYQPEDARHSPARLALASELRQALEQGDLSLHYQPKVDLATGLPVGVEALARWPHPKQGWVPPEHFIALAEQTGLIRTLSRWALETAVHQAKAWDGAGLDMPIAVNLSAHDLDDPALPQSLADLLRRSRTSPELLHLVVELSRSIGGSENTTRASSRALGC
jgi:EAL domain-containing protein (putative c-di-GMP-specific phosphodiesterase class I)